jgi:hypothetical protein
MRFVISAVCVACIGTGYLLGHRAKESRTEAIVEERTASSAPVVVPIPVVVTPPAVPVKVALNEPVRPEPMTEPVRPETTAAAPTDAGQVLLADAVAPPVPSAPAAAPAPQVQDVANQVGELRTQVQEVQAHQQQLDQNVQQRLANQSVAMGALQQADANLASGNTDIDDQLAQAESLITGPPVAEIDSARTSLQNDDLYFARSHLERALLLVGVPGGRGVVAPSP